MKKHMFLKRTAAALLAALISFGSLPGTGGKLIAQNLLLTAGAEEFEVGNPAVVLEDYDFNEDETMQADIRLAAEKVVNIGKENRCTVTVAGDLSVGEGAEIHLYNGSFLIITGKLDLFGDCKIICEGNSKVILRAQTLTVHTTGEGSPSYASSDILVTTVPNLWNTQDISADVTVTDKLLMIEGAKVNVADKACVTVNGDMEVLGELHIKDGSYVIVNGSLSISRSAKIICDGNAKIIICASGGDVPVSASQAATFDVNDIIVTSLKNLTYVKDYIASKDYFKSKGVYYIFDGEKFNDVAENPATIDLKQLCTKTFSIDGISPDIKFSQAAYSSFKEAYDEFYRVLPEGLQGYTIDGETCDDMSLREGSYYKFMESKANLLKNFNATAGCGGAYIITEEEKKNIASANDAPVFTSCQGMVGYDLTMNFLFNTSNTSSLDNYKVVVTGSCPETGKAQGIEEIKYSKVSLGSGVKATIPINHINDPVSVQLYYKGKPLGKPYKTSMKKYYEVLASEQDMLKEISDSILVYGDAAANYFNKNETKKDISNQINAYRTKFGFTDAKAVASNFPTDFVPKYTSDQAKVSMVLDTTVTLKCYIALMDDEEVRKAFSDAGYSLGQDEYGYYLPVSGLRPADMYTQFANITLNGTTYNFNCCAWVYRVLTEPKFENDTALQDLAVAIYAYANAGFNLFSSLAN